MSRFLASVLVASALAACTHKPPMRSFVLHGVHVNTDMAQSLAIIGEAVDAAGQRRPLGYAMLGDSAGHQIVGAPTLPEGTKIRLQFGVDAKIWQIKDGKPAAKIADKTLRGLSGAVVGDGSLEMSGSSRKVDGEAVDGMLSLAAGNGALELRGAVATTEIVVEPRTSLMVGYVGGQLLVGTMK